MTSQRGFTMELRSCRKGVTAPEKGGRPYLTLTGFTKNNSHARIMVFESNPPGRVAQVLSQIPPSDEDDGSGLTRRVVQAQGEWQTRTNDRGRVDHAFVADKVRVLTGPAVELMLSKRDGAKALADAGVLFEAGDGGAAYLLLEEYVSKLTSVPAPSLSMQTRQAGPESGMDEVEPDPEPEVESPEERAQRVYQAMDRTRGSERPEAAPEAVVAEVPVAAPGPGPSTEPDVAIEASPAVPGTEAVADAGSIPSAEAAQGAADDGPAVVEAEAASVGEVAADATPLEATSVVPAPVDPVATVGDGPADDRSTAEVTRPGSPEPDDGIVLGAPPVDMPVHEAAGPEAAVAPTQAEAGVQAPAGDEAAAVAGPVDPAVPAGGPDAAPEAVTVEESKADPAKAEPAPPAAPGRFRGRPGAPSRPAPVVPTATGAAPPARPAPDEAPVEAAAPAAPRPVAPVARPVGGRPMGRLGRPVAPPPPPVEPDEPDEDETPSMRM